MQVAEGDLAAAEAQTRGLEALARSQRWKTETASEKVNNQIAFFDAVVVVHEDFKHLAGHARGDEGDGPLT